MDTNILVLGGSYFAGRIFSILSARRGELFDFQYTPFSEGFARTYRAFSKL